MTTVVEGLRYSGCEFTKVGNTATTMIFNRVIHYFAKVLFCPEENKTCGDDLT